MIHSLKDKKNSLYDGEFNHVVTLLTPVEVADKSGRFSHVSEFQPFDLAENLKPFQSVDFSIGSLQAVGALNTLKTTYMGNTSSMVVADKFENLNFEPNVPQS